MDAARIPLLEELSRTDREVSAIQKETNLSLRTALINAFLKEREALFGRIARNNIRRYRSLSQTNDFDDILQVVRGVALGMVEGSGYTPFAGVIFEVVLQNRAHTAVQSYARSTQNSNLSGDTEARKRSADWHGIVTELTEILQREPTVKEVDDRYRELYRIKPGSRVDQELQTGRTATMDTDVVYDGFGSLAESSQRFDGSSDTLTPEGIVVEEASDIIEAVIQECSVISDELASYARAWIESVVDDSDQSAIAAKLGISQVKAVKLGKQMKDVMREYLITKTT